MRKLYLFLSFVAFLSLACSLTTLFPTSPTTSPITQLPQSITTISPSATTHLPISKPPRQDSRCGNGICEGPENVQNCAVDCRITADAATSGQSASQEYRITNPTSNSSLYVYLAQPTLTSASPFPAVVLVPGGSGDSSSFRKPKGEAIVFPQAGYAVIVFDPDGRGKSNGRENYNGYVQQDGLAEIIRFVAQLPQIDPKRIGLVSYSYGITMASGALARYPNLPVTFLIDWEGPANRNDTAGCDGSGVGHLQEVASCDDEAFWSEREASTFIGQIRVPYQRIQSEMDHAQPDNTHAILMINNAIKGGVPWVRLNDLPPNQIYDPASPPPMLSETETRLLPRLVLKYINQMFELRR